MVKTMNLGKVAMTTAGAYDSSKSYERLTLVTHNHVSWVSRKDVPAGVAPGTSEVYWQKVAERGEQGIQGPVGPQGNSAFDGNGVEIVNNLTQGGEAAVLSAEQGKILDTKLATLSEEMTSELYGDYLKAFSATQGVGFVTADKYSLTIKKGAISVRLLDNDGVISVGFVALLLFNADNDKIGEYTVSKNITTLTLTSDVSAFSLYISGLDVAKSGKFYLEFKGENVQGGLLKKIENNENDTMASYYEAGYIQDGQDVENSSFLRSFYIPVSNGDVISSHIYRIARYGAYGNYLDQAMQSASGYNEVSYAISDDLCKFVRVIAIRGYESPIYINGRSVVMSQLDKMSNVNAEIGAIYPYRPIERSKVASDESYLLTRSMGVREVMGDSILGLWIKSNEEDAIYYLTAFRYRQVSAEWDNTAYTSIKLARRYSNGALESIELIEDRASVTINDEQQVFETSDFLLFVDWRKAKRGEGDAMDANRFLEVDPIVFQSNNTISLMTLRANGNTSNANLAEKSYIALPIPQLAVVNIVANMLPTSKTDDIYGTLEFNDMQGNVFAKKTIMNAQGTSSLGLPKKNISIDIMDENYEDSHEIKFGDWVAQDGFHLKSYMLDGIRVKPLAAYDLYESILLSRGVRRDRAWKRLQLPSDIPMASNDIADSYLQLDDGAKNHPSGFPIILYFNGVFHGIYCWQLKKHRANYHQKKSNAEHIHLDGNISNVLLWEANGVLDWDKWAGKKQESETIANVDGIEVRNPKKLILANGTEYDADTNAGELISKNSARYDATNADMVRTASVRASIESLSRRVYALTQMRKGADKKTAIAEVFDVDSIIDYIIFSQITGNIDGYKKNWQWVTYDGVKWAVNAYDLDGTWGWSSWSYYDPYSSWIHNDTPPVTLIIENYLDEIKARYKELRDKGVIDLAKIMQPLVNYVKVIGIDYYDMEFEKWTEGARDNLWRFESWMEESIKRTDALMGYNS